MLYRRSRTEGASFFFTVVTHMRKDILCRGTNSALIGEASDYVMARRPFEVDAFVLLPDHIHCIWTLPRGDNDFSTRWRLIKSCFSRRCHDKSAAIRSASRLSKGEQAVWQRRFWEHQIRDAGDMERHIEYIHYNPVKHGLAGSPAAWPHSSFHRYVKEGIYDNDWGAEREIVFSSEIGNE